MLSLRSLPLFLILLFTLNVFSIAIPKTPGDIFSDFDHNDNNNHNNHNTDFDFDNSDDHSSNPDYRTLQENKCGPRDQVISCCNNENKQSGGSLFSSLIPAMNCQMIPISIPIIGGSLAGAQDKKCSPAGIACCNKGSKSSDNAKQVGLANFNGIDISQDCTPISQIL